MRFALSRRRRWPEPSQGSRGIRTASGLAHLLIGLAVVGMGILVTLYVGAPGWLTGLTP